MKEILSVLEACGYQISENSESIIRASKDPNDMVKCDVNVAIHDVDGVKYFVDGWLLIREIIGEEALWTSVGREVGPKGMFSASSHMAGGWPIDQESDASISIKNQLLAWLDVHSQIENLVKMIENLYFEGEKISLSKPKRGLAKTLMTEFGFGSKKIPEYEVIFSPQNSKFLANLYQKLGNGERALFYAHRWIDQRGAQNVDPAYHRLIAEIGQDD